MTLSKLQRQAFERMTAAERLDYIKQLERELFYINASDTRAAKAKRAEYGARIAYLHQLAERPKR